MLNFLRSGVSKEKDYKRYFLEQITLKSLTNKFGKNGYRQNNIYIKIIFRY